MCASVSASWALVASSNNSRAPLLQTCVPAQAAASLRRRDFCLLKLEASAATEPRRRPRAQKWSPMKLGPHFGLHSSAGCSRLDGRHHTSLFFVSVPFASFGCRIDAMSSMPPGTLNRMSSMRASEYAKIRAAFLVPNTRDQSVPLLPFGVLVARCEGRANC